MRRVDDVSDAPGGLAEKQRGLAQWRAAFDEALAGEGIALHREAARAGDAQRVLPALADTVRRYSIPPRYFHDLISGAEMDLSIASYATFDRLREYCYRVAGTVGLTCIHVFGFRDSRAPDLAEMLGIAFQLTNILRDVPCDFQMGRVYLPQEELERFDCRQEDLGGGRLTPALAALQRRAGLALLRGRRRAGRAGGRRQPPGAVGAGAHLQRPAARDRGARLRCLLLARAAVRSGESGDSNPGAARRLVGDQCPRTA